MDKDDEKKKRKRDPFGLSDDIRYLEKIMAKMMKQAFRGLGETPIRKGKPKNFSRKSEEQSPPIRGFFVKKEGKGKPKIKKLTGRKSKTLDKEKMRREPLVDVKEEKQHLIVTAHLPGANQQDIKLKLKNKRLIISVTTHSGRYHKKVELPTQVEKKDYRATYKNGVLQVKLKKSG